MDIFFLKNQCNFFGLKGAMSRFYYAYDKNGILVFDLTKIVFVHLDAKKNATLHYGSNERATIVFPGSLKFFRMWIDNDEVYEQLMRDHETGVNAK